MALPDETGDDAFCAAVAEALTGVLQTFRPDLGGPLVAEDKPPAAGRQLGLVMAAQYELIWPHNINNPTPPSLLHV